MKSPKQSTQSKRVRQALEEQVLDHVRRYHPEMGDIAVEISPSGTLARVREKLEPKTPPKS